MVIFYYTNMPQFSSWPFFFFHASPPFLQRQHFTSAHLKINNREARTRNSLNISQNWVPCSFLFPYTLTARRGRAEKSSLCGLKILLSYQLYSIKQTLVHQKCDKWSRGYIAMRKCGHVNLRNECGHS